MNLDPETIRAILAANENDPQYQALARQQKMADMMRQRGMTQTDPLQAGRRVIPNYGGIASQFMQGMAAQKMQPGLDKTAGDINNRQIDARKQYLDALMASMRRGSPQGPMPPQQPMPSVSPGYPMQPNRT